jgi:hypothetical protein
MVRRIALAVGLLGSMAGGSFAQILEAPVPSSDRLLRHLPPSILAPGPTSDRLLSVPGALGVPPSAGRGIGYGLDDPVAKLQKARAFSYFFHSLRGDELICDAMDAMYDSATHNAACSGKIVNSKKTVEYSVSTIDGVSGTYELELTGVSSELALKSPYWVERHRFYVGFGFNADLDPQVVVVDFEPMLRTTPSLLPEQDNLYEYISLEHDSELRVFQEVVKNQISRSLHLSTPNGVTSGKN